MNFRYDRRIDPDHFNENLSQEKVLMQIRQGSTVLECGCATGYMTRYMRDTLGCQVYIIESDREAFAVAKEYAEDGICADLLKLEWLDRFRDQRFDYVIFSDVLEHLYDPQSVLNAAVSLLKPDGSVLASLPNVAHSDVLLGLWKNRWRYTEVGLLDHSHIRFFSEQDLNPFFQNAGLSITNLDYTFIPMGLTEQGSIDLDTDSIDPRVLHSLEEREGADVYQFIIRAQRAEYVAEHNIQKRKAQMGRHVFASLYYSEGDHFSEASCIKTAYCPVSYKRRYTWNGKNIRALRFDPIEKHGCVVSLIDIASNAGALPAVPANGLHIPGGDIFFTDDPQYNILLDGKEVEWIEITAEVFPIEHRQGQSVIVQLLEMNQSLRQENHRQQIQIGESQSRLESERRQWNNQREEIQANMRELKQWYAAAMEADRVRQEKETVSVQKRMRELAVSASKAKEKLYLEQLAQRSREEEVQALKEQLRVQTENAEYLSHCLNVIENATFWKATKPFRAVLDFVRGAGRNKAEWRQDEQVPAYLGELSGRLGKRIRSLTIDIIIPIYNGFDFLEQLFRSVEQTQVSCRLILIEDKSTDSRVRPFLKEYAGKRKNVQILENEKNLGFVQSVNRGLRCSKNHVVLVNTDVVLPPMWLERLILPIVAGTNVASATPFTNSGTICSFPTFCQDNKLFLGLDVEKIDREFIKISPRYPILPTGVGFCMAMSRNAIEAVGVLDADAFGRGYGEENDWCRRAAEAGFAHVQVENLFVYHQHGGSFTSREKQKLIQENHEKLLLRYPDYDKLVMAYIESDPCASIRSQVKLSLLRQYDQAYTVLALNHSWGGGASAYLSREREKLLLDGKRVVQVEYLPADGLFQFECFYAGESEKTLVKGDFADAAKELPARIDEIWVNELVSYPDLFQVLEEIPALAKRNQAVKRYFLHDLFPLCPTINLLNEQGDFCGLPTLSACEACLRKNPHHTDIHGQERKMGMAAWRANWLNFLKQCDEIRVFSNSSKTLLLEAFEELAQYSITVIPHKIDYMPEISMKKKSTSSFNIGIVGAIDEIKGVYIVQEMAELAKEFGAEVRVVVIGVAWPPIPTQLCPCTGKYERGMLPHKILENDVDMVLIPSIWPETFSYTAQEAMAMGLPIACFDIGAPAERVAAYEKGIVLPQIDADLALHKLLEYKQAHLASFPSRRRFVLLVVEEREGRAHRRAVCFQEELLFQGVTAELMIMEDAMKVDISRFDAVVMCRCSSVTGAAYLKAEASRFHIKLFFDIDDLLFNAEALRGAGLSGKLEKTYFREAARYCALIRLSDGVIAAAQTLGKQIERTFPAKPVCVRHDSVSLEAETQLVCAGENAVDGQDSTTYLAFRGEAWTSERDLAEIAVPLLHIFQKYPNVRLRIYGQIQIPADIEGYCGRIEQCSLIEEGDAFAKQIARDHIHLAPMADTAFNACAAEQHWMEAALAGRVTVMSRLPKLEQMIRDGETGFLCRTTGEWEDVLSLLVEFADRRSEAAVNAQREVLKNHLTRNSGEKATKFVLGEVSN